MKLNRSKKGFTIVELVIVIGVIGILSAILIPTFVNLTEKAKNAAMKEECAQAYSAYAAEAADGVVDSSKNPITFLKQEAVILEKGTAKYEFTQADGWKEYTGSHGALVTSVEAEATFNTYTVYVRAAA